MYVNSMTVAVPNGEIVFELVLHTALPISDAIMHRVGVSLLTVGEMVEADLKAPSVPISTAQIEAVLRVLRPATDPDAKPS